MRRTSCACPGPCVASDRTSWRAGWRQYSSDRERSHDADAQLSRSRAADGAFRPEQARGVVAMRDASLQMEPGPCLIRLGGAQVGYQRLVGCHRMEAYEATRERHIEDLLPQIAEHFE